MSALERDFGFLTEKSLEKARAGKILSGKTFWLPKTIAPDYEGVKLLLETAGATVTDKLEKGTLALLDKKNEDLLENLKGKVPVFNAELAFCAILRQSYAEDEFRLN